MGSIWTGLIRLGVIVLACLAGAYVAPQVLRLPASYVWGALGGGLLAFFAIIVETAIRKVPGKSILGAIAGFLLAMGLTSLCMRLFIPSSWNVGPVAVVIYILTGYLGIMIGVFKGKGFTLTGLRGPGRGGTHGETPKILDTSVIIDGRIADVCETGFIEGPFVIPQFVLRELQHIADSSDSLKRNRGRRGLDVLNRMQKQDNVGVQISDQDFAKIKEVDAKLVELAKWVRGKIITNDFNLNKVAELQGVPVLNINQLTNALKPVVLPGEKIHVQILKDGKEPGQGVGYLEDGTMVVVEEGKRLIGVELDVVVTSVLQTTAGRMIFARPREENGAPDTGLRAGKTSG